MDSGNNRRHTFKSLEYFPLGVKWITSAITGIHGREVVKVGIGESRFATVCLDGTTKHWKVPNSVYNPKSPVNLLCQDRFHYNSDGTSTGHEWKPLQEKLFLAQGRVLSVQRDQDTHLPLLKIQPFTDNTERTSHTKHVTHMENTDSQDSLSLFTHTHLQPLSTDMARKTLNDPLELYFNTTVKHNMIDGIEGVKPIPTINKAHRPDSWYAGRMTQRTVPKTSRRPANRKLSPGSHLVSDIGEVPIKDNSGCK